MTTLLIIIGVLLIIIGVAIWFIAKLLGERIIVDGWDNEDMINFTQSVTNYEVGDYELREWINTKELEQIRFSDN